MHILVDPATIAPMRLLRAMISLFRGTPDQDAYREYASRLLDWAQTEFGLTRQEYAADYADRYLDADGRDLFLDYLLSVSKDSASYLTEHPQMLADRRKLYDRFGLPVLTMSELRDQENKRLNRMDSPLRL